MTQSLHIIGSRQFGGAEQFFLRLVNALNQEGHTALPVIRPSSPLSSKFNAVGMSPVLIPMRNGWDIFSVSAIRKQVRTTGAAIVQTYMGRASRLTRLPAKSDAVHIARLGGYYKISGYYRHADAWIGNTRGLCDYMIKEGLPAKRVFCIGNFVDRRPAPSTQQIQHLRRSLQIPDEAAILFSLGRFIDIKGFDDLIEAFALMQRDSSEHPRYLVLAGDGPLRKQLERQAEDLKLGPWIRWAGWQNDPSLYYHLADIFVCPSRHETLGNVILEAWAHHLPVVSTQTPGATELIEEDWNGLLAPCEAPKALAERLNELLESGKTRWDEIAGNGSRTLRRLYSRKAVIRDYLNLYDLLRKQEI